MSESIKYRFGLRGAFAIFKHPTPKNTQLQKSQGILGAEGIKARERTLNPKVDI